MTLDRRERGLLAVIVLAWAMTPLVLHFLLPAFEEQTGPVMMVGLVAGGLAVFLLLRRAARRLDLECRRRLSLLGFGVVGLHPDLLDSWIPVEHRQPGRVYFDGFPVDGDPRVKEGYQRCRDGVQAHLFGYRRRTHRQFTVLRLEDPRWRWPEFSCVIETSRERMGPIDGWERIHFDLDPGFSEACRLQAPEPGAVVGLFGAALRRLALEDPRIRVFASGHSLTLYSDAFRLIPDEAEAFLGLVEPLADRWARTAGIG